MSILAQLAIALVIFVGGFAGGIKWEVGIVAARDLKALTAREADAKAQFKVLDRSAGQHAATLENLNDQLGAAREKIARLSGRTCLDSRTVGVLNATGIVNGAAPAVNPASAPGAPAAPADDRAATDNDVAGYIALIRTMYAKVADQLNQILDIEDRRYPP